MSTTAEPTKPKPTLLAFHGSGSNAMIHGIQLARLNRLIKDHFNIEVLEAPFPCPAGPGILPFFSDMEPYARWLPPSEAVPLAVMRSGTSTSSLSKDVESLVRETVHRVATSGGRVVGLIGFSQGTKVVAGLLQGAQMRAALGARGEDWLAGFRFALSVCGSYAPALLPQGMRKLPEFQALGEEEREALVREKIALPVLHVQGEKDEWKWAGDGLIETCYERKEGASEVEVWDMGHHYPQRGEESERMRDWLVGQLERLDAA